LGGLGPVQSWSFFSLGTGLLEKYTEAEKLKMQVLDARNRILGVEHTNTINTMVNLAAIYHKLGEYAGAGELGIQVLDARNRILGVEHPETILAMENLAATYHELGKYAEAEKLEIQVLDARNKILGVKHPGTITAMANAQEAQEIQVLDAGRTNPREENLHSTQVVLNPPIQVVLPDTIMNLEKKGMYLGNFCLNPL